MDNPRINLTSRLAQMRSTAANKQKNTNTAAVKPPSSATPVPAQNTAAQSSPASTQNTVATSEKKLSSGVKTASIAGFSLSRHGAGAPKATQHAEAAKAHHPTAKDDASDAPAAQPQENANKQTTSLSTPVANKVAINLGRQSKTASQPTHTPTQLPAQTAENTAPQESKPAKTPGATPSVKVAFSIGKTVEKKMSVSARSTSTQNTSDDFPDSPPASDHHFSDDYYDSQIDSFLDDMHAHENQVSSQGRFNAPTPSKSVPNSVKNLSATPARDPLEFWRDPARPPGSMATPQTWKAMHDQHPSHCIFELQYKGQVFMCAKPESLVDFVFLDDTLITDKAEIHQDINPSQVMFLKHTWDDGKPASYDKKPSRDELRIVIASRNCMPFMQGLSMKHHGDIMQLAPVIVPLEQIQQAQNQTQAQTNSADNAEEQNTGATERLTDETRPTP